MTDVYWLNFARVIQRLDAKVCVVPHASRSTCIAVLVGSGHHAAQYRRGVFVKQFLVSSNSSRLSRSFVPTQDSRDGLNREEKSPIFVVFLGEYEYSTVHYSESGLAQTCVLRDLVAIETLPGGRLRIELSRSVEGSGCGLRAQNM